MSVHRFLVDGEIVVEEVKGEPSLDQLQKWVGGLIEHVAVRYGMDSQAQMFIDEEGKLKKKGVNRAATTILHNTYPHLVGRDVIVGDAVILTGKNKAS